ncbi:MAG: hypothetical protein NZ822_02960 [Patescibacteria group bacterium]|nr:hypothetical protein [Patescibacteria group bacterium]
MILHDKQGFVFYNLARGCIEKGEPIGSKLLAKRIRNRLSAPMLRVYLRRLVSAGYLENTSHFSGRSPTSRGWYVYVRKFKLRPEKKIPDQINPNNLIDELAQITKNVVFSIDLSYGFKIYFKGLKNIIEVVSKQEIAKDILSMTELVEEMLSDLDDGKIRLLIGERLKFSQTKKVSLIAYRKNYLIIGFLGQQINCYHTNLILLKKIFIQNGRY